MGEPVTDGRKRRTEANQLRRSVFGRKHDKLGESKVRSLTIGLIEMRSETNSMARKMTPSDDFGTCSA